jgi:phosphomannomutase
MAIIASVSGVRGIIGTDLTPQAAVDFASAFGTWLGGGKVVVGGDTRPSGQMLRQAVEAGLMACGCDVIDLGIVSTPGAALMVKQLGARGGVVITASHNPVEYNGIKFLTDQGWAPPPVEAEKIFAIYAAKAFAYKDSLHGGGYAQDDSTHARHIEAVLRVVDAGKIRARRFRVVLDAVNGAGGVATPTLLEKLGCQATLMNCEPTGLFPHEPEPIEKNLRSLCAKVKEAGADVGFAQDPDADRLVIVDEAGRFIGEEYTLALAVWQVLKTCPGPVASNLSTSRLVDAVAKRFGVPVVRTPVGEANVAAAMFEHKCTIGGEGNGGVIDPRVIAVRNSYVGIGHILQLLAEENAPLSRLVASLPTYAMIKRKSPLQRERLDDVYSSLKQHFAAGQFNLSDGLRIDLPEGWLHIRPSNTEPIVRIISEASDVTAANCLADAAGDVLKQVCPA